MSKQTSVSRRSEDGWESACGPQRRVRYRGEGNNRRECDNAPMSTQEPRIVMGHCPQCGGDRKAYIRASHRQEGGAVGTMGG